MMSTDSFIASVDSAQLALETVLHSSTMFSGTVILHKLGLVNHSQIYRLEGCFKENDCC